jgi:hypothetical protein
MGTKLPEGGSPNLKSGIKLPAARRQSATISLLADQ